MYRKIFTDKYIKNGFSFEEAVSETDFLLEALFGYTYKEFMLGKALEKWQIDKLKKIITERVTTHKPIQQIIGTAYFYGRKFFVNENTLIPRPETEILVSKVLELAKNYKSPVILDIGTGTGCIPITLVLENNNIKADAIDISDTAIETARKNALFNNVFGNISFIKSDLFENITGKYNIIVSNPPYIPLRDKDELQIEVKDYDPAIALFTKDEYGIEFYEKIIKKSEEYLLNGGYIAFELGINQSEAVYDLLKENNFCEIEITKDYNNTDRVIVGKINK